MERCNCDLERRCNMCNAFERSKILDLTLSKQISRDEAANRLKLSTRQLRRLLKAYKQERLNGLISKKKGLVGRVGYSEAFKQAVLELYTTKYPDFGPTFASEKLLELEGIDISHETLRSWLIKANKWHVGKRSKLNCHPPRARRERIGELIQVDGSLHYWFESRGPRCTLLLAIDDATSNIMTGLFVESENTDDYLTFSKRYVLEHGKPISFYLDRHSVFKVNAKDARSGDGLTHFGRAMSKLEIKLIYANSAPAKGRVERKNGVLQDRLVKELRLQNISTIADANAFLPTYIAKHNAQFGKQPQSTINMHTALSDYESCNIDTWFTKQFKKKVSKNMTVQHNNIVYYIKAANKLSVKNTGVVLIEQPDGVIRFTYRGAPIDHKTLGRKTKNGGLVVNRTDANELINTFLRSKTNDPNANILNIHG
jgi:transposase